MINNFDPEDIVKTCDAIESGIRLHPDGIGCCYKLPVRSPLLVTSKEINSSEFSHDLIVQRRKELFEALNRMNDKDLGYCKTCSCVSVKKYKDVNFEFLGGCKIESSFNLATSYKCNLRCNYCYLKNTTDDQFAPATYNMIDVYDKFKEKDRIKPAKWIQYNGGEPTIDKDFDANLKYMIENNMGTVCIFSNSTTYKQVIFDLLKENKIFYETSLDAGTASTYEKIHGVDAYEKVMLNIIRYKNSGTANMMVKYIVLPENMNQDNLLGFVMLMAAIRPPRVYIASEYVCDDNFKIHPDSANLQEKCGIY